MEEFVQTSDDDVMKTVVGFMLFCVYSCARFSDAAAARGFALDSAEHVTLVDTSAETYKTAISKEKRTTLLPLVAFGSGLDIRPWALFWNQARSATGANEVDLLRSPRATRGQFHVCRSRSATPGTSAHG